MTRSMACFKNMFGGKKLYVGNAIADAMFSSRGDCQIQRLPLRLHEAVEILQEYPFTSCVGHASTAALYSETLGMPIEANRVSVSLDFGDAILIGAYQGPRLPEGCTTLPEGATLNWVVYVVI